ncbi:AAA family ATPase [Asticcacaulis sp.]|uniref:AAA family ATPase n=1 Tax=Asticcacaulis sp. TaxID=1872648 RepID=UPI003F7C26E9
MTLKLKEVFTPGGQPSVTYVARDHLELEDAIRKVLAQGYTLNVVTGPTKSGKTVLCTRVLDTGYKHVVVEGGQVRTEADFWSNLAHQLNVAQSATKSKTETDAWKTGGAVGGGFPGIASATGSHDVSGGTQTTSSLTYQNSLMLNSLKKLADDDVALLVDDFHYIPSDVQRSIIQALKGPIFKGLSVIFLAVPHRAFDPITVEDELQGRFKHFSIPPWSISDLSLIPKKGFDALNVQCSTGLLNNIVNESFGNPLLVQEICSNICIRSGIYSKSDVGETIDPKLLVPTLEDVAQSKGFPKYRKLKEGPQARKERKARRLKSGGTADIYEALMLALSALGPKPRTHYDEIRSALKDLMEEGQLPQKHEISAALAHMSKIARENIEGEPPLEFVKSEDALVITDPFLLFYMKWEKQKSSPGSALN